MCRCAGHHPALLLRQCGARTPSFLFSEKEKMGEKRKNMANRRAGKEHVESFLSYLLEIAIAPKGALVRNSAYLLRSVSFPRATSALTRVSILGRSPKLYNRVWSPRLRTASPINQNKIIPPLAATSYGSPYGLGGLSRRDRRGQSVHPCFLVLLMQRSPWGVGRPTFRCVWLRRHEAGLVAGRTGCRMVISGRTCGDAGAKSFYFSCKGAKPAATQGLPRGREWVSPAEKVA